MDSETSTRFSQEKAARLAELVKDNKGNLFPGKKAFKNAAQTVERKYQKYEKSVSVVCITPRRIEETGIAMKTVNYENTKKQKPMITAFLLIYLSVSLNKEEEDDDRHRFGAVPSIVHLTPSSLPSSPASTPHKDRSSISTAPSTKQHYNCSASRTVCYSVRSANQWTNKQPFAFGPNEAKYYAEDLTEAEKFELKKRGMTWKWRG
uniref:Uncharacterized protein n=1 Tax=Ditylenchus dipsaci TaxID=166011 RepID=A0A915DHY6_9BILA